MKQQSRQQATGSGLLWEAAARTGRQKSHADTITPVHLGRTIKYLAFVYLALHRTVNWSRRGTNKYPEVCSLCGGADLSQELGGPVGRALSETLVMQETFLPYLRLQKLQP